MTALLAMGRVSVRQLLGIKRTLGLGLIALGPTALWVLVTQRSTPGQSSDIAGDMMVTLLLGLVLPGVALILGTAALGDEKENQTLSFLTVRPIGLASIALVKFGAAFAMTVALAGGGALVLAIVVGVSTGTWSFAGPFVASIAVGALGYLAVFVPLGFITKRATIIGAIYVFLWELSITSAISALAASSIWRIATSALMGLSPGIEMPIGTIEPGAGGALVKVLVLAVIGIGVATVLLRRRDIT